jgi:hypothetical protein
LCFISLIPLLYCILCKVQTLSIILIKDAIRLENAKDYFIKASNAYILFKLSIYIFKVLAYML